MLPLKRAIDAPHFTADGRFIHHDFIDDIYKNDTNIVFSKYYFFYFFDKFTSFDIVLRKKIEKNKLINQVKLIKDGKIRGIMIKDLRTNNSIPLTYQLLFKHAFMNMSLKSWCEYLSAICNGSFSDKKFNQDSFYVEKIKQECFFFDIEE